MQEKQPLVSVIIPVYNSIRRLAACLDHVVALDYPNLEVILVDDCSTDGSLEICRDYEKKYSYFHVITKENEGVSAARNLGLQQSHGEYIQFIDSDDFVKKNATSVMVNRMEEEKSDVIIAGYYDEKAGRDQLPKEAVYEGKEAFIKEFPKLFSSYFLHVPWNKLYRREVIEKGFPTDLDKGEDLIFNLQVFERAHKFCVIHESVYDYYNIETDTLSFRFRENAMGIEERLILEVADFYQRCGGREPAFLDLFYLSSIKNKFYDLMRRSGKNDAECKDVIKVWLTMPSVQKLYQSKASFGKKDKILLFLMKHHYYHILMKYYR
ncbi:MAG: glycosyltransferase family 2 protein [Eubacterium sp.]